METKKEFEDETQELRKTIPVEVSVELSVNDIFNWLTDCQKSCGPALSGQVRPALCRGPGKSGR